jgi:hypothetical protein
VDTGKVEKDDDSTPKGSKVEIDGRERPYNIEV